LVRLIIQRRSTCVNAKKVFEDIPGDLWAATSKALDGLFTMLGQEEKKKIREGPVAQVTDLLKKVFGK